tara:strand:+ start:154 stop:369 length:216 start_codon:yes stop_codon:yes gene_type:complete
VYTLIFAVPLATLYFNYSAAESIKKAANSLKEGDLEEATSELHRAGSIWSNLVKLSLAIAILYGVVILATL